MGKKLNWLKKVCAFLLVLAMVIQPISTLEAADNDGQYEIYPTPQSTVYKSGTFIIRSSVNVVFEAGIDDVTKEKLDSVLEAKGISAAVSDKAVSGTTNILVGIYGSGGYVDNYAKSDIDFEAETFTHIDPYVLDVDHGTITILGGSTDSAFYGVVSLMHILNQIDGKTIRNLIIEDYANTKTRGFIEGYYGIPWSNEDRISLMEFGGQFKMTSYVFAPKDDPYHSSQWRVPYPEDKLAEIVEMAAVGNANKCRFVWTIHPFMYSAITAATYATDIEVIKSKFEQLYNVGVRQFGVLGDDAGSLPRSVVISTMKDLQEWADSKGDVYSLVFCPAGYNDSWQGDYSELNEYDAGFPEEIQIFWTGQAVCQPVEQKTLDNFRRKNLASGQEQRRSPLFWLNWPVNDINMSRLMMGKGSLLHNDVNPEDLSGVVTNPMQDAQASKAALFAVADYAWNISDFDADKSWADGFDYIDADASDALHTLAKHMSDPSPNGHGLNLAESEELQPLLTAFKSDYEAGVYDEEAAAKLIAEFEEIIAACDEFHKLSKNAKLKEEILPFSNALKALCEANILLIQTAKALEDGNVGDVWSYYSNAAAKLTESQSYDRATLNGVAAALPGSKHIRPFADKLNEILSVAVNTVIDDSKQIVTLITNRTDTPEGAFEKLTDNIEATEVIWDSPNSTTAGTYIGLTYSKAITLNDVTFKMGQSGNMKDTFNEAKIQYTADGKEWIDLEGSAYTDMRTVVTVDGLDLQVKGVRLISTADKTNMWLGCRDIIVNIDSYASDNGSEENTEIEGTGFYNTENMVIRNGSIGMMTDGLIDKSGNGYVGFAKSSSSADPDKDKTMEGAYVGIEFPEAIKVSHVVFSQGTGDHINKGTLEYTVNGTDWIEIDTYNNIGENLDVTFDAVSMKAIRLVNNQTEAIWWRIYEIDAYYEGSANTPLNKTVIKSNGWGVYSGSESSLMDGSVTSGIWYSTPGDRTVAGEYLGLDLGEVAEVGKVTFAVGIDGGDKWENYRLEYSTDNTEWTAYKEYTGTSSGQDVHEENLGGINARYVRIVNLKDKGCWVKFGEFNVERYVEETGSEFIYTNVDALKGLSAVHEVDETSIRPANNITLASGQYVGVQLERIKDITDIITDDTAGLTLESSKNGIIWTVVTDASYEDARFVRLINKTDAAVSFNLTTFVVKSFELQPISVLETTFEDAETHLYAFDQDRTTEAVLQNSQYKGQYIVYDLGQTIDLESLKLVLHDGTTDYPRHAKVSVSIDGETWEEVMLIGNQDSNNPGEAENTDNIAELFPDHEISYYTKLVTGLDQEIRFIKFEITRNKAGADKWVRIREIEINGGNMYLPSTNDPTIVTTGKESAGNTAMNIIDGDVSTTFKPGKAENGFTTYNLSENTEIGKITILQSPSTVSKAAVTVETVKEGRVEEVVIGQLMSSFNEFNVSSFDHVLSITITWEAENVPEIHEIITSKSVVEEADKAALNAYYETHKAEDTSAWTKASKDSYKAAAAMAKYVLENEYATQAMADSAYIGLKNAVEDKVEIGNIAAFKAQTETLVKEVLAEENYTADTWRIYAERLAAAEAVNADSQLSQEELHTLAARLESAVDGLVYSIDSMEELTLLLEALKGIDSKDYTKASYEALTSVFAEAEAMIEDGNSERQNPMEVKALIAKLPSAEEALVSIAALNEKIAEAEAMNHLDNYTSESTAKFNAALKEAKETAVKADASKTEVAEAAAKLQTAMDGLEIKGNDSAVRAEIARLKALDQEAYTSKSYDSMMEKIQEIEAALEEEQNDEFYAEAAQELDSVRKALVEVTALKEAVKAAESMDESLYTEESFGELMSEVKAAKQLYVDGTEESIAAAIESLGDKAAKLHVAAAICNKVIDSYNVLLLENYTEASANALKAVVDAAYIKAAAGVTESELAVLQEELDAAANLLVATDDLLNAIEKAETIDRSLYTTVSYNAYAKLISDAKALLKDGTVTAIADMTAELNNPSKYLVKIGEVDGLQEVIEALLALDLTKYTDDSVKVLEDEIEKAKFLIMTGEATAEEIENQIKVLKEAFENLKLKSDDVQDKPETPDSPVTGDTVTMMEYMVLLFAAVMVLVFIRRRNMR